MTRKCHLCPAQIRDVTFRKKDGTTGQGPIDAEPSDRGNIVLDPSTCEARVLVRNELAEAKLSGLPLYINHFVTCPQAEAFRRRKQ